MIPLASGELSLVQGRQPDLPVMQEAQLTWVPYFSTVMKAAAEENVIASVFCPSDLRIGDGAMTCKLDTSGPTPVVTYTARGKTTKLSFAANKITHEEK
jgi:hypothetical protein